MRMPTVEPLAHSASEAMNVIASGAREPEAEEYGVVMTEEADRHASDSCVFPCL